MRILILMLGILFISCTTTEKTIKTKAKSADGFYEIGLNELQKKNYAEAVAAFDEVEQQYPFAEIVPDALIMQIYTHYLNHDYLVALNNIDRFNILYPNHKDIDYVAYLKALCYYKQIRHAKLDQYITIQAKEALHEVINKYPDSKFAKDAKFKLDLVYNNLAAKEMDIGMYYLQEYKITAAIGRFQNVVKDYQFTTYIQEALYRMTECFYLLGNYEEATKYAAILHHNYPDSTWYNKAYNLLNKKTK